MLRLDSILLSQVACTKYSHSFSKHYSNAVFHLCHEIMNLKKNDNLLLRNYSIIIPFTYKTIRIIIAT